MFVLTVPVKRTGSCGIIVTFWRSSWSPIFSMFKSSKEIEPFVSELEANSRILSKPNVRVDFPDPVLPTTPIFSQFYTLKLMLLMTTGSSGRY